MHRRGECNAKDALPDNAREASLSRPSNFSQAGPEVSALLGRMPSAVSDFFAPYPPGGSYDPP